MALDYKVTSQAIIDGVGGVENIASATHCMTRLRLVLKDEGKANDDVVKGIKGVKSVIKQGGQYQVVIGNEVSNLFKEFKTMGNFGGEGDAPPPKAEKKNIQWLFGYIAGCLTPLLPAMLGTGMIKVLLTLITAIPALGVTAESPTYQLFYSLSDAFFYFLPILLGWSIAKKTGGSAPLYMTIGAALCYPTLVTAMGGTLEGVTYGTFLGMDCMYMFGVIPVLLTTYTSSVLPMLLMIPIMKWSEEFADKISPNVLKAFMKPMVFFLICFPILMCLIGPIGGVLGNLLAKGMAWLYATVPWLTVGVLSALMPFIVMTGMHYALLPLFTLNLATLGYDVVVLVTMFCSNIAQGGAAFGVAAKTKDEELRSEGLACGISATVAGVTEPAMYGINLRFVKPMIAAVIAAGTSGLLAGLTQVRGYTMGGSPSFLSLITFIGGDSPYHGVIWGAICGVLSVVLSFVLTLFLYKDEKADEAGAAEPELAMAGAAATAAAGAAAFETHVNAGNEEGIKRPVAVKAVAPAEKPAAVEIDSPLKGEAVALSDVPDEVFATGILGEGIAIIPAEGKVYAPCDGVVSMLMDSKHAVSLVADNGAEILIHVGLDTVKLEGKPFEYHVTEDQEVKKGDLLLTADLAAIEAAGCPTHTPVVITNSDDYVSINPAAPGPVEVGARIIDIT